MRLPRLSLVLLVAVTSAQALTVGHRGVDQSSYALKSAYTLPPSLLAQWEQLSSPPSRDYVLDLRFSLAPQPENTRLLHDTLFSNHPEHAHWTRRKHLSRKEVARLASPHPASLSRFRAYLASHRIDPDSAVYQERGDGMLSSVVFLPEVPIDLAERLLNTRYAVYKHRKSGREIVRALSYSLPPEVHSDIEWVQPTNYFGSMKAYRAGASIDAKPKGFNNLEGDRIPTSSNPTGNVTLAFLQELYNTTGYNPSVRTGNMLGISGYLEEYANLEDLKEFYSTYLPAATNFTPQIITLNGASNSQNLSLAGLEANLDTQYGGGMSYPIPNTFYSVYGRGANVAPNISYKDNGNEPYDVLLSYLLARDDEDLPSVLSNSYGESEDQVPLEYAQSVCEMYAHLGARGVSVLHSSGDFGVGQSSDCGSSQSPTFRANFPASCPFVTAVGGTTDVPETTDSLSGGGFSNYFLQPSYQSSAVSSYISKLGNTYQGYYNASGRALPDISAQSHNYQTFIGGSIFSVDGTSASCPVVAGIVALLNDVLLKDGRETLGFLNPFLYSSAIAGLNDITTGSNNVGCFANGFNATLGWDPATGNGTPNFGLLKDIISAAGWKRPDNNISITQTQIQSQSQSASATATSSRMTGGARAKVAGSTLGSTSRADWGFAVVVRWNTSAWFVASAGVILVWNLL